MPKTVSHISPRLNIAQQRCLQEQGFFHQSDTLKTQVFRKDNYDLVYRDDHELLLYQYDSSKTVIELFHHFDFSQVLGYYLCHSHHKLEGNPS